MIFDASRKQNGSISQIEEIEREMKSVHVGVGSNFYDRTEDLSIADRENIIRGYRQKLFRLKADLSRLKADNS